MLLMKMVVKSANEPWTNQLRLIELVSSFWGKLCFVALAISVSTLVILNDYILYQPRYYEEM